MNVATPICLSQHYELLVGLQGCRDIVVKILLDECRDKFVSVTTLLSCFSKDSSRLCHDISFNVAT